MYYEEHPTPRDAIRREQEMKGWVREKKLWMVEQWNAGWLDLAPPTDGEVRK